MDEASMAVDLASSDTKDKSVMVLVTGDGRFLMCYDVEILQNIELIDVQKELFKKIVEGELCSFSVENESKNLLNELIEKPSKSLNDSREGNWRKKRFYD
jgi:hypothetical protein